MTIDAQYTVGFSWARQYGFRLSQKLQQQGVVSGFGGKFASNADHLTATPRTFWWVRLARVAAL